ncbi:hypothetical protein [Elizabethkingia ursingii]|uniref:hypothetical protein n=1 Tax=Elizabethkingia ursingii TaxID=1756150 RepID=UPI000750DA8A|nr:hypothetical protein [Elizabethkingia ursingii]KUY31728.1 hypothetical protein ATB96_00280 [Elizabethkingia ursingii]
MNEISNLLRELLYRIDSIEDESYSDIRTISEVKNKLKIYNNKFFSKNEDFEYMIDEIHISEKYEEYILAKEQLRSILVSMLEYISINENEYQSIINRKNEVENSLRDLQNDLMSANEEAEKIRILRSELDLESEYIKKQTQRLLLEEEKLNDFKAKLDISDKQIDFQFDAKQNKNNSMFWITLVVIQIIVLIILISSNLNDISLFSNTAKIINSDLTKQKINQNIINNSIYFTFGKLIFTKLLLYSIIILGIKVALKNYNSQMHNYVINSHKSNSLKSVLSIMSVAKTEEGNDKLLVQATQAIFEHQNTGFDKGENNSTSPNLINNVIDTVTKKI